MNLGLLQQALNEMKAGIELAISERYFTSTNGEVRRYDTGTEALKQFTKGGGHIFPVHEAIKSSVVGILTDCNIIHHSFPPIGQRSPELTVPSWSPKKQDVVITFGECEEYENNILSDEDVCSSIVIGVRSQMQSIAKNKNTIIERTVAEPFLTRFSAGPEVVMGELFILPVEEYYTSGDSGTTINNRRINTRRTNLVEVYISSFIRCTNRSDINDWRQHLRYERACLTIVRMEEDLPRFYRTLQEMHAEGIVSQEFYNANHEAYDQHLSPVNFARDLVAAHRARWPDLYPDAENQ